MEKGGRDRVKGESEMSETESDKRGKEESERAE